MTNYQEQVLAYLKGELGAEDRAEFEDELARSDELRAELASSRALLDLLEAANDETIVKQVSRCIQQAIKARASDIHIVGALPDAHASDLPAGVAVSFRVDGRLQEWMRLPGEQQRIVDRWKVMAGMNLSERRRPQDGLIPVRYEGRLYDLRVHIAPTVTGERITARVMSRSMGLISLDQLGLSEEQQAAIRRILGRPRGLALVGGFAGNGKTTLLYAMLAALREPCYPYRSVVTIEDGIEHILPGASQTQVDADAGLTFAAGLRSAQRSDPEVVYISQLRNLECAELCVELALTGALTLSQLHVSSALMTIQRLREMGIVNFLIGYTLLGAVGLRLVRRVCPDCKEEYMPASGELYKAGLSAAEDGPFYHGRGCETCRGTGFVGRIGLFEVLEIDDMTRSMIIEEAPLDAIWRETFGRQGDSLWDDARDKMRQGLTTVEEVNWALADYPHPRNTLDAALGVGLEIDAGTES